MMSKKIRVVANQKQGSTIETTNQGCAEVQSNFNYLSGEKSHIKPWGFNVYDVYKKKHFVGVYCIMFFECFRCLVQVSLVKHNTLLD